MKLLPNLTQERVDPLFRELATKAKLREEAAADLHAFLSKRFKFPKRISAAFGRLSQKQLVALGTHIRKLGEHEYLSINVEGLSSTSPPESMDLKIRLNLRCTTTTVDTSSTTWDEAGNSHTTESHSSTTTCEITGFSIDWD